MNTPSSGNFTFDYLAILRGIWRRHKAIVALIFLGTAAPLLCMVYFFSPPLYMSKATVSIEPTAFALAQLPFLKDPPTKNTMAAHMILLKSRSLSESVIDSLAKESLEELRTGAQYVDYWLLLRNKVYGWLGKPQIVLSQREQAISELREARMEFSRSWEADNVYSVSAVATRPAVTVDLVNAYIKALLSRTRSEDREDTKRTQEFLELQYDLAKKSLARDEEAVAKFQQRTGLTKSASQTDLDLFRLAQLENNLSETQATREVLSGRIDALRKSFEQARSKESKAFVKGESDGAETQASLKALKGAQEYLNKLEARLSGLREQYTESHPRVQFTQDEIVRQKARVAQLARQVPENQPSNLSGDVASPSTGPSDRSNQQAQLAALEREAESLRTREESLKLQIARARPGLQKLSAGEAEFRNLLRSLEANRGLVSVLSDKLMALKIRDQVDPSMIRIIDPPTQPVQTTSSKTRKVVLMILGLAGSIAFGVAFGIEVLRQPVETESDIARATGLPVLGSVGMIAHPASPQRRGRDRRPILLPDHTGGRTNDRNASIHVELYRAIRANIESERLKTPFRSILVTSSGPHEGKSTTTVNLAHIFQEFGRRVLLIEADLRRPSLSSTLGVTSKPGLVDVLRGTATLEESCRRLPSGVSIVPGQIARGDAATLLASPQFRELLQLSGTLFDLILVDSPPILAVPDDLLVVNVVDRVMLVARSTTTSTRDLRKTQAVIARAGGRVLGVILNWANPLDVAYYHPRYRKYYPTDGKGPQEATRRPRSSSREGART